MATETVNITTTLADDSVTNAKLAEAPEATIKLVPVGSGTSNPVDGDADQASEILDAATDPFARTSALAAYIQDGQTLSTGLAFPGGGLRVKDNLSSQELGIVVGEDLTANRQLTIIVNNANRTLELTGDAELEGVNTGDQDLSAYVQGPASSTNNNVPQWDGTTGKLLKDGLAQSTGGNLSVDAGKVVLFGTKGELIGSSDGTTPAVHAHASGTGVGILVDQDDPNLDVIVSRTGSVEVFAIGAAGEIRVGTSPGVSGQILTSSGPDAVPTWTTLATSVRAVVLTGLSLASSAAVAATDTILAAFGKLQAFNNLFTTLGLAIARLANFGAVGFIRINADNTATARTASEMRTDLGLGTAAQVDTGTGAANVPTITQADARYTQIGYAPAQYSIAPVSGAAAVLQWTNMPAALTFFLGQARWFITADLTNRTQIRISGGTLGSAASANAKLRLLYKTAASGYSATIGDYSTIGTSEVQMTLGTSVNVVVESGWIDIVAGAKTKVIIALAGIDGDGTADPGFSGIWVEVK